MKKVQYIIRPIRPSLNFLAALLLVAAMSIPVFVGTKKTQAAVQNPEPSAKVSFTFDDGLASALTQAQPTLTQYGLTGTAYVTTGCIGMSTAPNTCRANTDAQYMTWTQVSQLKAAGWEIGSHTVTHPYLASSDASDGQPNVLTPQQVAQELTQSKSDLATHGIDATSFSSPYGDYNPATLAQIAKVYASHRGFADTNDNNWPYNDYLLNNMQVQAGVTVAQVKAKIDAAIANKQWLVLTMHDIKTNPSNDPDDYEYSTSNLSQIAAYVKTKQDAGLIQSININQGLVKSDTNLLPNSSFDSGIAGGWTTDSPSTITHDTGSNGSYPSSTNSVKMVASTANKHLFSPQVAVNFDVTYMLKNFLNVQARTSGEVAFYIDEYNANNDWISGQYKTAEQSVFAENLNFTYKPTSNQVTKARLQVIITGNSGITAYLDNSQWFALHEAPTPPPTNLVANGTFDNGIADGWTTNNPTNITADAANNGSPANPVKSVKLVSTTSNKHLFSPQVTIESGKTYSLTSYLDLRQISGGEIGFYIDEYDNNNNWISGQYKTGVSTVSAGDVSFQYTPTSASVKKAQLQIIVVGNSGITAYFDHVRWYAN